MLGCARNEVISTEVFGAILSHVFASDDHILLLTHLDYDFLRQPISNGHFSSASFLRAIKRDLKGGSGFYVLPELARALLLKSAMEGNLRPRIRQGGSPFSACYLCASLLQ